MRKTRKLSCHLREQLRNSIESDLDGIRIDHGYAENGKVTPFYDPLISKVIVHGNTRDEAIEKSIAYFSEIEIEGLKTNIPLFTEF